MNLNYFQSLTDFFVKAPDIRGYKPMYAATFSGIIHLLSESRRRTITLKYAHLNGLLRLSEDAYYESLNWLDHAGLILYFRGKGKNAPAEISINVPEFPEISVSEAQNLQPGIAGGKGGSTGVGTGVSTQGGNGGSSQGVDSTSRFSPPPIPPYRSK
ncbi:hypothetical protein [Spirosoma foliorum]|uniref:Uncharacterized protein n=1 Tax=Spirosoma foliorum TaxID=2710596 RepID=A0A7G5H5D6_9BACT|nr:hypothetical protein [Spirosoma foliorum]QMW06328.1 hypothetical protein H3H32_16280 [Spirosoma foliorum]